MLEFMHASMAKAELFKQGHMGQWVTGSEEEVE